MLSDEDLMAMLEELMAERGIEFSIDNNLPDEMELPQDEDDTNQEEENEFDLEQISDYYNSYWSEYWSEYWARFYEEELKKNTQTNHEEDDENQGQTGGQQEQTRRIRGK